MTDSEITQLEERLQLAHQRMEQDVAQFAASQRGLIEATLAYCDKLTGNPALKTDPALEQRIRKFLEGIGESDLERWYAGFAPPDLGTIAEHQAFLKMVAHRRELALTELEYRHDRREIENHWAEADALVGKEGASSVILEHLRTAEDLAIALVAKYSDRHYDDVRHLHEQAKQKRIQQTIAIELYTSALQFGLWKVAIEIARSLPPGMRVVQRDESGRVTGEIPAEDAVADFHMRARNDAECSLDGYFQQAAEALAAFEPERAKGYLDKPQEFYELRALTPAREKELRAWQAKVERANQDLEKLKRIAAQTHDLMNGSDELAFISAWQTLATIDEVYKRHPVFEQTTATLNAAIRQRLVREYERIDAAFKLDHLGEVESIADEVELLYPADLLGDAAAVRQAVLDRCIQAKKLRADRDTLAQELETLKSRVHNDPSGVQRGLASLLKDLDANVRNPYEDEVAALRTTIGIALNFEKTLADLAGLVEEESIEIVQRGLSQFDALEQGAAPLHRAHVAHIKAKLEQRLRELQTRFNR